MNCYILRDFSNFFCNSNIFQDNHFVLTKHCFWWLSFSVLELIRYIEYIVWMIKKIFTFHYEYKPYHCIALNLTFNINLLNDYRNFPMTNDKLTAISVLCSACRVLYVLFVVVIINHKSSHYICTSKYW